MLVSILVHPHNNLTLRASLGEQNAKYPRRKCRSPHATNCTLSKKCATSCAKKFNSAWTRPVSRLEMRSCYRPRIIYMQHVGRVARFRLSTSKAPSYAFSFISPSLQAFRARDRIRITLFDKVARPGLTRRLIVPAIVCRADNWPVHASFASFSNGKVNDPRGGR